LDVEREHRVPSSIGFVPAESWPDERVVVDLEAEGRESYWHDIKHDGRLPYMAPDAMRRAFTDVLQRSPWSAQRMRTFRSGQLLMSRTLLEVVAERFDVDLSLPDMERGGPYGGIAGCRTVQPFRIGSLLEVPLTLPQDVVLHQVERRPGPQIYSVWSEKLDYIVSVGGVAVANFHPIWVNPSRPHLFAAFRAFVAYAVSRQDVWITTPSALKSHLTQ
jgi:hypothetical protein